jgi:hypothetical protein
MSEHWLDRPANVRRLWRAFIAVLLMLVLIEPLVPLHPHFTLERIFGFHAWYGLLACAAMILVAKALGALLKRPDDYYERHRDGNSSTP